MLLPRLVISGLSGGAGKTMLSLGLARAFARSGLTVRALKKGPDYIDAAWLALAARSPQGNLDPFFMPGNLLAAHFLDCAQGYGLALVEGNRGLFDGLDLSGSCSTAELARILKAPVLLIIDCTKMTRTAAALVKGCRDFEPDVTIGGVILNRTGNARHQALVRTAVEDLAETPVLGVLPRNTAPFIVERHMGLAGLDDQADVPQADALLDRLADFVSAHVDLAAVRSLSLSAPPLGVKDDDAAASSSETLSPCPARPRAFSRKPRIGYARDAAFWFYYKENLDALERAGAELVPLSLLDSAPWPAVDGLYLGGGLPELYAQALADNTAIRAHVAALSRSGLPLYAECGGFMYLTEQIRIDGNVFPMAGIFPCAVEFCSRPQGLGYVEAEVTGDNPFHPAGTHFRGHEFHFSRVLPCRESGTADRAQSYVLSLRKGKGMAKGPDGLYLDGLLSGNTFASYTHIFAPAVPHWAPAFVALCGGRLDGGRTAL